MSKDAKRKLAKRKPAQLAFDRFKSQRTFVNVGLRDLLKRGYRAESILWFILWNHVDAVDGLATVGTATLADLYGSDRRHVGRMLKRLEAMGYITVRRKGRKGRGLAYCAQYQLNPISTATGDETINAPCKAHLADREREIKCALALPTNAPCKAHAQGTSYPSAFPGNKKADGVKEREQVCAPESLHRISVVPSPTLVATATERRDSFPTVDDKRPAPLLALALLLSAAPSRRLAPFIARDRLRGLGAIEAGADLTDDAVANSPWIDQQPDPSDELGGDAWELTDEGAAEVKRYRAAGKAPASRWADALIVEFTDRKPATLTPTEVERVCRKARDWPGISGVCLHPWFEVRTIADDWADEWSVRLSPSGKREVEIELSQGV